MKRIELFEPAMCCPTGVCGPSVDPELLRMAAVCEALDGDDGFEVVRHSLSQDPGAFVASAIVSELLEKGGTDVLPITVVDGRVMKQGAYPTNAELSDELGVRLVEVGGDRGGSCRCGSDVADADSSSSCCGSQAEDDGGCCCGGSCC